MNSITADCTAAGRKNRRNRGCLARYAIIEEQNNPRYKNNAGVKNSTSQGFREAKSLSFASGTIQAEQQAVLFQP